MGTTGLIYVAIAVAWLAYLVPHFLKRREVEVGEQETDPAERFSDSLRIIRTGAAPVVDHELAVMDVEVSTPLTRRAAVAELRSSERRAAARRRRVLIALLGVLTAVVAVCVAGLVPWWSAAVPGGLVVIFAVVARISVSALRRDIDRRYAQITRGSDERTVFLTRKSVASVVDSMISTEARVSAEPSVRSGGLWEPLPITVPTYVSKPLAPRTVRTIDLSAPDVAPSGPVDVPVTADGPDVVPTGQQGRASRPWAVGE